MTALTEKLIDAVRLDLTPSLGVTEPGAIAYAAAAAARALKGKPEKVTCRLNSGIYKNSFTCFVPGTDGMGCAFAAALGAVGGDPALRLGALENITEADIIEAKRLVDEGCASAFLGDISPEINITAEVVSGDERAEAVIEGRHDRLVSLKVNGVETLEAGASVLSHDEGSAFRVSSAGFENIVRGLYEDGVADGLGFLDEAVRMDLALFEEGRRAGLMPLTLARAGSGTTCRERALLLTCGAIEARVRGAKAPAMAITGSGSHGILCTLPVHEAAVFHGCGRDDERKALLLSALVTMYIKENSGLLSSACGCVLAGGTGAALGLTYLLAVRENGGTPTPDELIKLLSHALNSMAASVTGMICHGGNTGCSLKAAVGVDMAFAAAEMAMKGFGAESVHGILGPTPDLTILNVARVAKDMLPVESTILDIMEQKARR